MQTIANKLTGGTFSSLSKGERLRMLFVLTGSLLIVVVASIYLILGIGKPYLGVDLSLTTSGWTVGSVDANGIASQMGIEKGDKPVEINGQAADVALEKYKVSKTVMGPFVKELVVVDAQGHTKTANLEGVFPSWQVVMQQVALTAISLILWLVGFYVFLKRPKNAAAMLLCIFGVLAGLSFGASIAGEVAVPTAMQVQILSSITAPWTLVNFMLVLPEENVRLRKEPWTYLVFLPVVVTVILLPIVGWKESQPVQSFRTVRLLEEAGGLIAAAGVAVFNYFHTRSANTKQQMRIVLLSSLAALIPLLLLMVIPFAVSRQTVVPPGISILFVGFIPLGLGYAVVVQRLMDIDVFIRRSIIYGAVALVMATILSLVLFVPLVVHEAFGTTEKILLALAAGWLATILFGPTERWVEVRVDKLFYKDRYDYRKAIDALSNSLKLLKDPVEISRVLVGTAVGTLNLAGANLYIKQQSGDYEIGACQGIFTSNEMKERLKEMTFHRNGVAEFPNPIENDAHDIRFVIPMVTGDKEVGLMFLSPKNSRQEFSSDDMFLLQGMASVGAMALNSAMLIRDVSVRDTFVSIASHELRTPLTAVIGYSDLLLRRDPPEATRKQWLQMILDSGTKIAEMVDDLLDVSRIRTGKILLKIQQVQVSPVLSELAIAAGSTTDKHNFVLDVAADLNEVFVDRNKFSQIISNLLNNAIKYSPQGGRITLSARNKFEEDRVIVSVADEGLGISDADKASMFQTFHRIQRPETIGIRGIGLGLYIVKEWTEAMNGKVWFESELNKGTTFYVAFPTRLFRKAEGIG